MKTSLIEQRDKRTAVDPETVQHTLKDMRKRVHAQCVVCGAENVQGLHMEYDAAGDGTVQAVFVCNKVFEGYPGMMHGGIISSILDGAMGNCMFAQGQAAVTVELAVKFRHPVVTGQEATVSAKITRDAHPLYLLEAEIVQGEKVKATAKGKYYDQSKLIRS